MTDTPAAFGACYSDFKLVRTRGVIQLIFEVPIEKADHALQALGGMPAQGASTWFAIAKMEKKP